MQLSEMNRSFRVKTESPKFHNDIFKTPSPPLILRNWSKFHKMVKYAQTIRRQIADELFECVWPFCVIGA